MQVGSEGTGRQDFNVVRAISGRPGTPGRVLIVDEEKTRGVIAERLARRGYKVFSTDSGERALEIIHESAPDVVLLELKLPGMDGLTALERALALRPEMVAVMVSAHGTVGAVVGAMKRGAIDFLEKPLHPAALEQVIDHAFAACVRRRAATPLSSSDPDGLDLLVGSSVAMRDLREMVPRVAASNSTVLIEGESGSGKEVVARAIHHASVRAARAFVQLNCAALPEPLLESELFGHERGAFTDAKVQKRGLFEVAEGGSALLDEIGDLPPGGQAKLLRLLEAKTFRRVGGVTELRADVRIVAATNASLERRVAEGKFRADLFFRLNVVRIDVPPLREHRTDVPELAAHFVARFNRELKRDVRGVSAEAMERLCAYSWPGNVRELRNVIERAFILHPGAVELHPEHLAPQCRGSPAASAAQPAGGLAEPPLGLEEMERRALVGAMERARGNQSQAARLLRITRDTLRYRLKKHGLLGSPASS